MSKNPLIFPIPIIISRKNVKGIGVLYELDSYKSLWFLYFNHTRTNSLLSLIAIQQHRTQIRIKTIKGNYLIIMRILMFILEIIHTSMQLHYKLFFCI